jgi:hypothetical protein
MDSDDRDVENEALVFVTEALKLIPSLTTWAGRPRNAWHVVDDAKDDIETAMRNRRAALDSKWTPVEQFSHRRVARLRSAREVEELRQRSEVLQLIDRANITHERVLDAIRKASAGSGEVRALDVAVTLLPELEDTQKKGRQVVINRVATVMRKLARSGRLVQHRPEDTKGDRVTCTYALAGVGSDV